MQPSFSLPSSTSFSPFHLATILPMLFLVFQLILATNAANIVDEQNLAIPQQQMEKRFYAWDEMSAKRSLIPARPELLEEVGIVSSEAAPSDSLPIILKRVPNSKIVEWKRSLRQRRPKMLAKLFFGPIQAE